ncbi:MAG TPA: hypothetical protein V6C81_07745 [Planktothrix sp.]
MHRLLPNPSTMIAAVALATAVSFASPALAAADKTPPPPFPIAGKVSRNLQKYTGLNFVGQVVANQVAQKVLRRRLGSGHIKVRVRTYSLTDLCAGKVQSVNVELAQCLIKAFPIGDLQLASANPIWFDPGWHGHRRGLKMPFMFNIKARLNRAEIANALNNPKVSQSIRGLKLDLPGLGAQQLQIINPKLELQEGNIIKIDAVLITQGGAPDTGVPIKISGRPTIEAQRIWLRDMAVESPDIPNPVEFAAFVGELVNPIFDMGRYDRKDHAFRITQFVIKPDKVLADGTLVLCPKEESQVAAAPGSLPK